MKTFARHYRTWGNRNDFAEVVCIKVSRVFGDVALFGRRRVY